MDAEVAEEIAVDVLCAKCQEERRDFRQNRLRVKDDRSPGCNGLLLRALAGEGDALQGAQSIFEPFLQKWVAARSMALDDFDADLAGHDAWTDFCLGAPKIAAELLANEQIGRAINYMKRCALSQILMHKRKSSIYIDRSVDIDILKITGPSFNSLRDEIRACIRRLFPTRKEEIIARERLMEGRSAQAIAKDHPDEFVDAHEVHRATERVRAKLKNDPEFRALAKGAGFGGIWLAAALLEVNGDDDMPEQACRISDSELLEYVNGVAAVSLIAQIEASPECVASAQAIKAEMATLRPLLRLAFCPEPTGLVDYHAGVLRSTSRLLVWKHVQQCPHCQAELQLLAAMDAVIDDVADDVPDAWTQNLGTKIRQFVTGIFIAPELRPDAIRGEILEYQLGSNRVLIQVDQDSTKPPRWSLMGRIRSESFEPVLPESVTLVSFDAHGEVKASIGARVDAAQSLFAADTLPAGYYDVLIVIAGEDAVISRLPIGYDPRAR